MKKFVKVLSVVLVAVMCASMFASCGGSDSYTADNTTFKIGVSGPLTGAAAIYGNAVQNGAKLAVKEINANGGLFGSDFELLIYDDQHDASKVSNIYATQLEKGMQVSLGCTTSDPCKEYKALAKEDNVFFITPSASADVIPENAANAYQVCFSDSNQGAGAASYVNENYSGKTIGVLYCAGDVYSTGILAKFKANLASGITVVEASFNDGDTDFSSQVAKLKDCEFVFMPIYYTPAYAFMVEANKVANNIKVYYGCDGLDGIDGNFDTSKIPQEISYLTHFDTTKADAQKFITAYKAEYNNEEPIQFAAAAYDAVYAIYNALKQAGEDKVSVTMSASEMCEVLKTVFEGGFTYSGATGENMKWTDGYVAKTAGKTIVKEYTGD